MCACPSPGRNQGGVQGAAPPTPPASRGARSSSTRSRHGRTRAASREGRSAASMAGGAGDRRGGLRCLPGCGAAARPASYAVGKHRTSRGGRGAHLMQRRSAESRAQGMIPLALADYGSPSARPPGRPAPGWWTAGRGVSSTRGRLRICGRSVDACHSVRIACIMHYCLCLHDGPYCLACAREKNADGVTLTQQARSGDSAAEQWDLPACSCPGWGVLGNKKPEAKWPSRCGGAGMRVEVGASNTCQHRTPARCTPAAGAFNGGPRARARGRQG